MNRMRVAFTPDPDDAFAWWGLVCGQVAGMEGVEVEYEALAIEEINRSCMEGGSFDVAAVSSAVYPRIAKDYAILSSGASVGRGYGPALVVSAGVNDLEELREVGVAIPGEFTTGALLFRLLHPGFRTVVMPCMEIMGAVVEGVVGGGVVIHEALLNWEHLGMRRWECLGKRWQEVTGLPIPVGLNVVRRGLGEERMEWIAKGVSESMRVGAARGEEARAWARQFSQVHSEPVMDRYIEMFANEDTLELREDCREALGRLWQWSVEEGWNLSCPDLDIVEVGEIRSKA